MIFPVRTSEAEELTYAVQNEGCVPYMYWTKGHEGMEEWGLGQLRRVLANDKRCFLFRRMEGAFARIGPTLGVLANQSRL